MDMKSIDLNKDYITTSLKNVDWESKLGLNLNNANTSNELLLDSVNEVLNYYCPLKKVSNSQKKNQSKPWISQDILKLIAVKNRLHSKISRMKKYNEKDRTGEKSCIKTILQNLQPSNYSQPLQ